MAQTREDMPYADHNDPFAAPEERERRRKINEFLVAGGSWDEIPEELL